MLILGTALVLGSILLLGYALDWALPASWVDDVAVDIGRIDRERQAARSRNRF